MSEPKLIVLNDAQELYVRAAEETAHIAGESICTHGEFTFCLRADRRLRRLTTCSRRDFI